MALPGFSGSVVGRAAFLQGFRDFCQNARVHTHSETDYQISVIAHTAIASFRFEMIYELAGRRYRSTGRDLWVFEEQGDDWVAVWRAMLDVSEEPSR
jgi:hypothetical protein